MPQIFSEWQAAYAERGLATFPIDPLAEGGTRKKPRISHYAKVGLKGSAQLALKFRDANGLACLAGSRNRLTIIDIDARGAEADRLTADAQRLYGPSRFIVRTGNDGRHLYYRHGGEPRKIRPDATCPIDVLGGGVVVLPPSLGAKQPYDVIEGHLDNLATLTSIQHAPLPPDPVPVVPDGPGRSLAEMREHDGRNNELFEIVRRQGFQLPPTREAFIAFAREQNAEFAEPLHDNEVIGIAASVFRYRQNGTLRAGQPGGVWFPPSMEPAALVAENLPMFGLLAWLQATNGPNAEFMVADGLADRLNFSRLQLRQARRDAVAGGWIKQITPPMPGRAARYRWHDRNTTENGKTSESREAGGTGRGVSRGSLTVFSQSSFRCDQNVILRAFLTEDHDPLRFMRPSGPVRSVMASTGVAA